MCILLSSCYFASVVYGSFPCLFFQACLAGHSSRLFPQVRHEHINSTPKQWSKHQQRKLELANHFAAIGKLQTGKAYPYCHTEHNIAQM